MEITKDNQGNKDIAQLINFSIDSLSKELNYNKECRYNLLLDPDWYCNNKELLTLLANTDSNNKTALINTIKSFILSKCFNWDHYNWVNHVSGAWYFNLIEALKIHEDKKQVLDTAISYLYRNANDASIELCLKQFNQITKELDNKAWNNDYYKLYEDAKELISNTCGQDKLLSNINSSILEKNKQAQIKDMMFIELIIGYASYLNAGIVKEFLNKI